MMAYSYLTDDERRQIKELQDRNAKLERIVAGLLQHFELNVVDIAPTPLDKADPEIAELVRSGKFILAMKLYRQKTAADLLTVKHYIESLSEWRE